MIPALRTVKFFVVKLTTNCGSCSQQIVCKPVTCEIGRMAIFEAKEIVPNSTYEVIDPSAHFYDLCLNDKIENAVPVVRGIGLGERVRNNLL